MGEVLYNNITLPDEWPPQHFGSELDVPMPVPYLESRPAVVPIDLGRQLFIDDFLIEESALERVYHKPRTNDSNPVLRPETPAELAFPSLGFLHGGTFWNPKLQRFEMFYHSGKLETRSLHIATSNDMVHWHRPDVGLGGGNMFLPAGGWIDGPVRSTAGTAFSVWLDLLTSKDDERYKMLSYWGHYKSSSPPDAMTHSLDISSDGIHWTLGALAGQANDCQSLFFNPFRGVWVYSIKRNIERHGESLRARWYSECPSFLNGGSWVDAVYWTCADRLDEPEPAGSYPPNPERGQACQLYALNGVAYESVMLGLHEIHRGPENPICDAGRFPKLTDLEMGFSRDGFHWHRPDRSGFIRASRNDSRWDRAYLHGNSSVCVIFQDKLVFPYCAFSGFDPDGSNPGSLRGGTIGVAELRRDGFASVRSPSVAGLLLTRPVTFQGEFMFVNVNDPSGVLSVEVCSESGEPLSGYQMKECLPISVDSTKVQVRWKSRESLAQLRGRPVRFRFSLERGDLYAFWVSSSKEGKSGGYVAGGGPAYSSDRDI